MRGALCFFAKSRMRRVSMTVPPMGLSQKVGRPFARPGAHSSKWSSPRPLASPTQMASEFLTSSSRVRATWTPGKQSANICALAGSAS